jgi:hypothetical protein
VEKKNFRHLGGFTTIDAGIALKTSEHLRLRVYVNNVTNQQGITTVGPSWPTRLHLRNSAMRLLLEVRGPSQGKRSRRPRIRIGLLHVEDPG